MTGLVLAALLLLVWRVLSVAPVTPECERCGCPTLHGRHCLTCQMEAEVDA